MIQELINLLPIAIAGSLIGVVTGLLPGLGPAQIIILILFFLLDYSPAEILTFYICIVTVSQYVDSLPAIYFGVPGETSALPSAHEGPVLVARGLGPSVIHYTSLGRIVAGIVSVVLTLVVAGIISKFTWIYSNKVQLSLLFVSLSGIFLTGSNKKFTNLILMITGYVLGLVGFHHGLGQNILTFGITDLMEGLPIIPVSMGLLVTPTVINQIKTRSSFSFNTDQESTSYSPEKFSFVGLLPNISRSSVLGWLLGLVPGLSYMLSSTGSYTLERWFRRRQNKYQHGDLPSVVASETGNTAGSFSTLLPLLYFGLPITLSETLVYNIMIDNGAVFSQAAFYNSMIVMSIVIFAFASLVGLFFSWPMASYIPSVLNKINTKYLWLVTLTLSIVCVVYAGYTEHMIVLYMTVFTIFSIAGWIVRKLDIIPLLFMFMLAKYIDNAIFNFIQLYL